MRNELVRTRSEVFFLKSFETRIIFPVSLRKCLGGKGWLIFESIIKVRLVGGLCRGGERFSFVFFNVTTPISLFRWETVQSVGMGNGSVVSFSM